MKHPEERITQLEMTVMHLQETIEELDKSIIDQHRRIEQMQREMLRLVNDMRSTRDSGTEIRHPEDEIPPHY
ncbi:MAG: SlyX family protein [Pirellulaceae bacterium]|nr:SlyX family protein [Pirellulaceae bacterium]